MMQVKWCWDYEVRDLGCYPTRPPYAGHAEPVHIIPLAALTEVVDTLEDMISLAGGLNDDDAWFGERRDAEKRIAVAESVLAKLKEGKP